MMLGYLKYQWSLGEERKRKEAFTKLQVCHITSSYLLRLGLFSFSHFPIFPFSCLNGHVVSSLNVNLLVSRF